MLKALYNITHLILAATALVKTVINNSNYYSN